MLFSFCEAALFVFDTKYGKRQGERKHRYLQLTKQGENDRVTEEVCCVACI